MGQQAGMGQQTGTDREAPAARAKETYISVDVEASGPIPGRYSMLSIGACLVGKKHRDFYVELKPISDEYLDQALAISGLSLAQLHEDGMAPALAMAEFEQWIGSVTPVGESPVFVAFNATFDWMFTHYYFMRFLERDPFGVSGLDIKAFYMGLMGSDWAGTSKRRIDKRFLPTRPLTHHALDDAVWQAEVFENLLAFQIERQATAGHPQR
jgi:DNA polymerase III epsilon subunit-like protein